MTGPDRVASEDRPASHTYRIVVCGSLSSEWLVMLDEARIEPSDNATTLWVTVADQVALRGLLSRLWDLNLTVVSVNPA
jgi:hypothetical protein